MKISQVIDLNLASEDKNGIWRTNLQVTDEIYKSRRVWENIYNYNLRKLRQESLDFNQNKLKDHLSYIENEYCFKSNTIFLEIGCGPAYIGDYLQKKYNCYFIGVDFNYTMLMTLKKYFEKNGYKKYILVHADINNMPIKKSSIDYIYGGGVIEHFSNTSHILRELYRILKKGGVSFNSVPAFNLWWLLRFFNNIPSLGHLKNIFEFIHLGIFHNKLLDKFYGYELSFTLPQLYSLHHKTGFTQVKAGSYAFHPSNHKISSKTIREIYYKISKHPYFSPFYYIFAIK